MPTYVYKFVETGETIEVQQSFSDDTLTEYAHPASGDLMAVKKVFQPVGVTFKGSGFFKTDNRGSTSGSSSSGNGSSGGSGDGKGATDSSSSGADGSSSSSTESSGSTTSASSTSSASSDTSSS